MSRWRLNRDLHAPTLAVIVQSDVTEVALRGIIVNAAGTLAVVDATGVPFTFTFTEFDPAQAGPYTTFPYRLDINIRKVMDTGTTIADADMIGLR